MSDIFGTDSKLGGTFKGTSFALSLGGVSGDFRGALVQQLSVNYARQLTRVWELGSRDQFYIEGHVEGSAQLQRVVGPAGLIDTLTRNLANVCGAESRVLTLSAANNTCDGSVGGSMVLESPVATRVGFGASVANFVLDASLELTFTGLSV